MKKNLFLVSALVMGMMSSCSSDLENVTVPGADQKLQPVELSLGSPSIVINPATRGLGTVGGLATDVTNNIWKGEKLYVNMMCISENGTDAWKYSSWTKINDLATNDTEEVVNFQNEPVTAPNGAASGAVTALVVNQNGRYYPPTNSKHAFYAYHIDDAAVDVDEKGDPVVSPGTDKKTLSVDFQIDGSQDLMVGVAQPDLTNVVDDNVNEGNVKDIAFSATSARKGVLPKLQMKHLLTRFTFEVKTDQDGNELKVEKIIVKSKSKGTMIVASADGMDDLSKLVTFQDEIADLELKEKDPANTNQLKTLESFPLTTTYQSIGEALMVAPGDDEYAITVVTSQKVGENKVNTYEHTDTIKIDGNAAIGSSYKVKITAYGLRPIDVSAELTGWENGGEIELTPGEFK